MRALSHPGHRKSFLEGPLIQDASSVLTNLRGVAGF